MSVMCKKASPLPHPTTTTLPHPLPHPRLQREVAALHPHRHGVGGGGGLAPILLDALGRGAPSAQTHSVSHSKDAQLQPW